MDAFDVLLKYAAVVVDVSDPALPSVIHGDVGLKRRPFQLITLLDLKKRKICYELGFGRLSPYTHTEWREIHLPRRSHAPIKITPFLWNYLRWVIYVVAEEKLRGKRERTYSKKSAKSGEVYKSFLAGGRFKVSDGQKVQFKNGPRLVVSASDKELLSHFWEEEASGAHWQKRIKYFRTAINEALNLIRLAKTVKARRERIRALKHFLFSNDQKKEHSIFRSNIMKEILAGIGQRDEFVKILKNCPGASELATHHYSYWKPQGPHLSLSWDWTRKGSKSITFKVFPWEGEMPDPYIK